MVQGEEITGILGKQNGSFVCLTQLGREGTKQQRPLEQQFVNKVINLNISSQKASISSFISTHAGFIFHSFTFLIILLLLLILLLSLLSFQLRTLPVAVGAWHYTGQIILLFVALKLNKLPGKWSWHQGASALTWLSFRKPCKKQGVEVNHPYGSLPN